MKDNAFIKLTERCRPISLLYVEDDIATSEAMIPILKGFFETMKVATNGEEGLKLYRENASSIDLIITDLLMPKLGGIEMIQAIREENKEIAIVVISAHNDSTYFERTIELGVDGYVFKPLKLNQLSQTLSKVVDKISLYKDHIQSLNLLKQYQDITNKSSIISKTDLKGNITFVNEKFCQISGYRPHELIGKPHNIVRHPDMPSSAFKNLWETIKDKKETWQGVVKNRAKNGDSYYVKTTVQPILNSKGEIVEYISLRHDITEIMSDKKQLFDYLEANRLAVLILVQIEDYDTLEKFYDRESVEKIEDSFGRVLLYLMPNIWGFQKVYQLENGLYALAIDRRSCQASVEEIQKVIEALLVNVKEYSVKMESIEYDISVICSFTYGVFKIFEDAKIGIEKAIKEKQSIIYADGLSGVEHENALKNIETIHTIKTALDNNKVISYFQPIVNNLTLEVEKYESLVRIIDESGRLLSPYHFLDIAKKGRYYSKITKIVLENSFLALLRTDKEISINLSVFDIEQEEIRAYIFELLSQYEDSAHRVVFELLESETIKDFGLIQAFIHRVKTQNVKIAIDDFGTGYSNFERLLNYEPDILKIDGGLIKNLDQNRLNRNIVETIIMFAKKQHMKTVAEFVENETIFHIVQEMGIDYSQGYAFGKPEIF
ncbi:MAG: EAL domain-containing protein [Sulfurospirillaceae bacterium]|nr:EAL domain-containing protein [Sulfurospirillaceae bacterium]